jgi:hypothetical protein
VGRRAGRAADEPAAGAGGLAPGLGSGAPAGDRGGAGTGPRPTGTPPAGSAAPGSAARAAAASVRSGAADPGWPGRSGSREGRGAGWRSADRRGRAPQRRPSDGGRVAGSGDAGTGASGAVPAAPVGRPDSSPPVPAPPPAGPGGMAVAGPYRRPRHFHEASAAGGRPCPAAPDASWPAVPGRPCVEASGPRAPGSRSPGPRAAGSRPAVAPAGTPGAPAACRPGLPPLPAVVGACRPGPSGVPRVVGSEALGAGGSAGLEGAGSRRPGPTGPGSARAAAGSVVTRCQSSTISNGRWTTEQAWWPGTAAGSSVGSRTTTRRPLKRDLTRSMACLRREVGRSTTTASIASAGRANQAWMLWSSVTRPVPYSSARRARPNEGSRRRSTTWRDI